MANKRKKNLCVRMLQTVLSQNLMKHTYRMFQNDKLC